MPCLSSSSPVSCSSLSLLPPPAYCITINGVVTVVVFRLPHYISFLEPSPLSGSVLLAKHTLHPILALEFRRPFLKVLAKLKLAIVPKCDAFRRVGSEPPQAHLCGIHPWTDLIRTGVARFCSCLSGPGSQKLAQLVLLPSENRTPGSLLLFNTLLGTNVSRSLPVVVSLV